MSHRNVAPEGCTYTILQLVMNELETNGYLVYDPESRDALMIDPGGDVEVIMREIEARQLNLRMIVDTHGHGDHVFGQEALRRRTGAPVWIHKDEAAYLFDGRLNGAAFFAWSYEVHEADHLFEDGDILKAGTLELEVVHVVGHTPGSSLLINRANKIIFSGDHVFAGSIGRTDLPGSLPDCMGDSLRRFLEFPSDFTVYPGHGPATTVAREIRVNPYLKDLL